MTFYIYDEKGMDRIYESGRDWRQTEYIVPVAPVETFTKDYKRKVKKAKKEAEESEKRLESMLDSKLPLFPQSFEGHTIVASQIMQNPVKTLDPEDSVLSVFKLFFKSHFRHAPIVTSGGLLVGIISDRCLFQIMAREGKKFRTKERVVRDIMVKNVLTSRPNTCVSRIAEIFVEERIGSMPVMNDRGELQGIITRSDILRTLIKIHGEFKA